MMMGTHSIIENTFYRKRTHLLTENEDGERSLAVDDDGNTFYSKRTHSIGRGLMMMVRLLAADDVMMM